MPVIMHTKYIILELAEGLKAKSVTALPGSRNMDVCKSGDLVASPKRWFSSWCPGQNQDSWAAFWHFINTCDREHHTVSFLPRKHVHVLAVCVPF